ncbi:MAG: hypothetical protein JRJ49_04245 [Deltaproteobacteria bacterium]|nr:hypothetical protein [Deltaproteobacteria bacterium]
MKEKYIITIDKKTKNLTIKETGELSKEEFFTLNVNEYPDIIKNIDQGKEALIEALRNPKFFPPYETAAAIADTIIHMSTENKNSEEILVNGKDYVQENEEEEQDEEKATIKVIEEEGEFINIIDEAADTENVDENVNIDDLLQDGDNLNVSAGIKIVEDEVEKPGSAEDDI